MSKWRKVLEVGGPTKLYAVDASNPSPYPLSTRLVRDNGEVIFVLYIDPFTPPSFAVLNEDGGVRDWKWSFDPWAGPYRVPSGGSIFLEMEDPPSYTMGFFLLEGGIILRSEIEP